MREKPALRDKHLIDMLWEAYGLRVSRVEFLSIGADINAAKYSIATQESGRYFLKAKKGTFEEISLALPQFLHEQGLRQVIPALKTRDRRLWTTLDGYTCILYPFVEGRNAFELELSDAEWIELGSALKHIHALNLPPVLQGRIPSETWSARSRDLVRSFLRQVESSSYADPLAAQMAAFLLLHRDEIDLMQERAGSLASVLRNRSLEGVLCHADLHAGNVLHSPQSGLHIIDWDDAILAPRERDLMFFGGGVGGIWNSLREEALFYQGYGTMEIDLVALTYYRFERILADVAEYSAQLLLTAGDSADRERGLRQFTAAFQPNDVVEIAFQTDARLKETG